MRRLWNKKRKLFLASMVLTMAAPFGLSCQRQSEEREPEPLEQTTENCKTVRSAIQNVSYYVDTLYNPGGTLLYNQLNQHKIYRNYFEKDNKYALQMYYITHEEWHTHNNATGYRYKYALSPQQYYRLCMEDEITANITSVCTARYEYLHAENKQSVIDKYKDNDILGFYFQKVASGEIKPESGLPEDRNKEWSVIANGTFDMWVNNYQKTYTPTSLLMLKNFLDRRGLCPSNPAQYKKIRRAMYSIGGVDFSKYLDREIEISGNMMDFIEKMGKVQSFQGENHYFIDDVAKGMMKASELPAKYQVEALKHILISAKMKSELRKNQNILETNLDIVYNKTKHRLESDWTYKYFIASYQQPASILDKSTPDAENKYKQIVAELYSYKDEAIPEELDVALKDKKLNISFDLGTKFSNDTFLAEIADNWLNGDKKKPWPKRYKEGPRRLSDEQSMEVPNYREPILTSASAEQNDSIGVIVNNFAKMPQVLKNCDTAAARQYLEKHNKSH